MAEAEFRAWSNPLTQGGIALQLFYTEPVGQEFIATLTRLDYVKLQIRVSDRYQTRPCRVTIHQDTITGPIIAVSEAIPLTDGMRVVRFTFSNPVLLTPGARYVLEINPDKRPPNYASSVIYTAWETFSGGRLILGQAPVPQADLLFELGVFMPDVVPAGAEAIPYVEQEPPVLVFPAAAFTNDYLTNFTGATLTVSNFHDNWPTDILSVSGSDAGLVLVDEKLVAHTSGGTNGKPLIVTLTESAGAADVQAILRRLSFGNPSETNYFGINRVFSAALTTTQGSVRFGFMIDFTVIHDPPVARLVVPALTLFLGRPTVLVRHKKENYVVLDASGSIDPDSTPSYDWLIGNLVVDISDRDGWWAVPLPPGEYGVAVRVSDGYSQSFDGAFFEVLTAGDAVRRLIPLMRGSGLANKSKLVALLRQAALAFDQRRYERGLKALQNFEAKLLETTSGEPYPGIDPAIESIVAALML